MKIPKIYLDTSVIGGCFDPEFSPWSIALLEDIAAGSFVGVTSEIVGAEIADAPVIVREKYHNFMELGPEYLEVGVAEVRLVDCYLKHKILTAKFRNDMLHIALATIAGADILVSWNFKHIVRYDKIRLFNAVNLEQGYRQIDIYSPREVARHEKDN
jgi:hypothetical protein